MNRTTHLIAAWCGPAVAGLIVVGLVLLAGFLPVPAPSASAEEIAGLYTDNLVEVRLGMVVSLVAMALLLPWGVAVTSQLRRAEGSSPVLNQIQLLSAGVGMLLALLVIVVWTTAAFRPDELAPETTRMLNDMGWIFFVFTWSPFSVWALAIALAIFYDHSGNLAHPRWVAYFNLWFALMITAGSLIIFFKTGPFAYNGLIGLYLPFTAFFVWVLVMTVYTIKSINANAD